MTMRLPVTTTTAAALTAAALITALLAGCAPGSPGSATPDSSGTTSSTTPTPDPTDTAGPDAGGTGGTGGTDAAPADLRADIVAAVSSGNTAALRDLFAATVHVTYAASEVEGDVSDRDLLVTNVTNATSASATWNFDLPASLVDNYRNNPGSAGAYVDDFPAGAIVGKSSENKVISFAVSGGLITRLFIANDEYALIFE